MFVDGSGFVDWKAKYIQLNEIIFPGFGLSRLLEYVSISFAYLKTTLTFQVLT